MKRLLGAEFSGLETLPSENLATRHAVVTRTTELISVPQRYTTTLVVAIYLQ